MRALMTARNLHPTIIVTSNTDDHYSIDIGVSGIRHVPMSDTTEMYDYIKSISSSQVLTTSKKHFKLNFLPLSFLIHHMKSAMQNSRA